MALAERAATAFRGAHPAHTLTVTHGDDAIPMVADGAMLRRVLDNLVNNAAKYSDAGAPIALEVRRSGADVEFVVRDQGIGIDAADVPHLFEPFFRTDRTRTRKTGGVGLGLALSKRIVDAHGGRIVVESRVGAGTTVAFSVPARVSARRAQRAGRRRPSLHDDERGRRSSLVRASVRGSCANVRA